MNPGPLIDYKQLRKINPQAARQVVLEYLKANGGNIARTARAFGIQRPVVYDILAKQRQGDLRDRSKAPHRQPRRTAEAIERQVVEAKNKTRLGPERLALWLRKYAGLEVAPGTIRHILRRHKAQLASPWQGRRQRKAKREFVDWYSAKPFEIVQVDLKYIRDLKALSKEQIGHLDRYDVPNYQWSALDVNSRFKLIGYSRERSWTNGLCWYLWVISWLRSHGVTAQIVFTVDNGEEFGGKSAGKIADLQKLIRGFGCRLIQNHKGHPEENAHLERSHRTDDEEFYAARALSLTGEQSLLDEALGYIYYYNNLREHSALHYRTPFAHLHQQTPEINPAIRFVQPIMLDHAAVSLGPWCGYHVLAQNQSAATVGPSRWNRWRRKYR